MVKVLVQKELIVFLALSTDDDIMICDPEGEYSALVKALGGEVIEVSASSKDHINPMDMVEGYGDGLNLLLINQSLYFHYLNS